MPKFNSQTLEQHQNPTGHYGFSAAKIDDLTATEYTLVTIVLDESGSTDNFKREMEKCMSAIVEACRKSPRADNLLLRAVAFGNQMREIHGFKLLEQCQPTDYDGCYQPGGSTALFDSSDNAIQSSLTYGKDLTDKDFTVNGIAFVLTDGDDNVSKFQAKDVAAAKKKCVQSEAMESFISILIGVNVQSPYIAQYLDTFKNEGGFDQNVNLEDASAKTLAKLADFISRSISSQSQALGSGGPSQSLVF